MLAVHIQMFKKIVRWHPIGYHAFFLPSCYVESISLFHSCGKKILISGCKWDISLLTFHLVNAPAVETSKAKSVFARRERFVILRRIQADGALTLIMV